MFCRGPDLHYFRLCCPDVGGTHSTALGAQNPAVGRAGSVLGRLYPLLQAGGRIGRDTEFSLPTSLPDPPIFTFLFSGRVEENGPWLRTHALNASFFDLHLKLGVLSPSRQMRKQRPASWEDIAKVPRNP